MSRRKRALGASGDRGATLVEYALVLSVLVFGLSLTIGELDTAAREEIRNQRDCVSFRPPPPSCQIPAAPAVTTTTTGAPGGGGGAAPGAPPTAHAAFRDLRTFNTTPFWAVEVTTYVEDENGPIEMADVRLRFDPEGDRTFFATCQTDGAGTCTIRFDVPNAASDSTVIQVDDILFVGEQTTGSKPLPVTARRP